jgi:hypothetical protein
MGTMNFNKAMSLYYEACHGGDRVEADKCLSSIVRMLNAPGGSGWSPDETATAIHCLGGPRRPPSAEELVATLAGSRAMSKADELELVF